MIEEKYFCTKCDKGLTFEEANFFGVDPEGRKVWCDKHWIELLHWIQLKKLDEKVPIVKEQAKKELVALEKSKSKFINLIAQLKRFITSLDHKNPELIEQFIEQKTLGENKENSGNSKIPISKPIKLGGLNK